MGWLKALVVFPAALLIGTGVARSAELTRDKVDAAVKKLGELAGKLTTDGQVPGLSIAVVYKDEVVYLKGFGLREIGKPDLVDENTVFQIASLSKPVSSTVVAALVSEGLLGWDARIMDLNPGFALYNPYPSQQVTVRDLFNHRSGLPGTSGDDLEDIGFTRNEIMKRLRLIPPSSSFRAGYAYSNAGLTVGALAAATPTGRSWEDVAQEKLYAPLGMVSTSSRHADFEARPNKAALHVGGVGKWEAKVKRNADAQSPAGGVSSSARDLANWLRLELAAGKFNGKLLIKEDALAATHVPLMARGKNPVSGGNSFYGLGWNVEFGRYGQSWGHAGAFSQGARTVTTLYPDEQLGIVVLTNAFPTGVPEGLADSFADLAFAGKVESDWIAGWNTIYAGLFGPAIEATKQVFAHKPDPATPALPSAAYAGTYSNAYVGPATVKAQGEQLMLSVGPDGHKTYPMSHFDRDMFLIYPDAEMADVPSPVTFAIGPDGKAASITIDNLNSNGLGTLTRSEE